MNLSHRDRRALILLAAAAAVVAGINLFWRGSDAAAAVPASVQSIPAAERRLARVRQVAATVASRQDALKQAQAELAERERGVLPGATAAQAQMQLLEVARRIAGSLPAKLDFAGIELGREVTPLGNDYGEVSLSLSFVAPIEQVVNFLTELTAQPEAIGTRDLRILFRDDKNKTVTAHVTLAGVVPRRLVPEKKGVL